MSIRTRAQLKSIFPGRVIDEETHGDWSAIVDSALMDEDISATGRTLVAGANAAAMRSTLALGTAATQNTGAFDAAGAAAAAQAASQPLDSDLTAIAALSTTAFGRSLLAAADAAALRTLAGAGTVSTLASDTDGTLAANSDANVATQKATKTYADLKLSKSSNLSDLADAPTARTNLAIPTRVGKTSDQSKTSDTTLANDSALTLAMAANTKYEIRLVVFFDTGATPDFKYALVGPTSPTLTRFYRMRCVAGSAPSTLALNTALPSESLTGTGTTGGYIEMVILWQNGANAGTFAFQWAQNTSDVGATTVLGGSYLEYRVAA